MADKEQVIQALRATLISVKGSLTLRQVNRDYRELQGEAIPFKRLGYPSLEKIFLEVPGFKVSQVNGEWLVDAIPSQETQHIATMVARQKSSKKPTPRLSYPNRFPRNQGSWRKPANYNSNYDHQYSKQLYRAKGGTTSNGSSYSNNKQNKYASYKSNETKHNAPTMVKQVTIKKSTNDHSNKTSHASSIIPTETSNSNKAKEKKHVDTETIRYGGKASQRLSNLITRLNTVDIIPLQLPAANTENFEVEEEGPVAQVVAATLEPPPPDGCSSCLRLEWTCRKLGLEAPVYKVHQIGPKRGPVSYDCTVKVGNTYSATSYPDSSPTEALARDVASLKLLAVIESSEAGGLPTSSSEKALPALADLVAEHEAGIWANTVPHLYREKYGENLPNDWQQMVENCPKIKKDRVVNSLLVLVPNKEETSPLPPEFPESFFPEDTIDSDLPPLQFPEEEYWSVFITVANSTIEIWLRIIGTEYSDAFEALLLAMTDYYTHSGTTVDECMIIVNAWYAVNLEDGGWQRAKVLDIDHETSTANVFLGDHGDDDVVSLDRVKVLEPQFRRLPAQAILCRLEGAEELAASAAGAELVRRRLPGEVLVASPGPRPDPGDMSVPLVLYDTSTQRDLNLNNELVADFCTASAFTITQKPCEVEVACVTDEGRVWVSSAEGAAIVRAALALLTSGPYRRPLPAAPAAPPPAAQLYMVRTLSGDWVRCTIISGLDGEGTVRTQLVDSGLILRAPLSSLVPLATFSPALNAFPHQALQVRLGAAERAAGAMVARLRELLVGACVLCRRTQPSDASATPSPQDVELFVRSEPSNMLFSVNNSINMEYDCLYLGKGKEQKEKEALDQVEALNRKKERISRMPSSGSVGGREAVNVRTGPPGSQLPPPALPGPGTCIDVFVAMAANPYNFVVQPNATRHILQKMMALLQSECPKLSEQDAPTKPQIGELYTVYYSKDESWYRVTVAGVVSQEMVTVQFCDYGDMSLFPNSALRPVPEAVPLATSLAPQAIKARLYDVSPLHQDWTVEDCIRFQELCVEKQFVGFCKDVSKDPLDPNEPQLVLDLVDTSTEEDIFLNKQLAKEGRARLSSDVALQP